MTEKPKAKNSASQTELDKAEKQFEAFDQQVKQLTLDQMNQAPVEETEPQRKIAQKDKDKENQIYLKPKRTVSSVEKFNEKFRDLYNFDKEYVCFEAENIEIIGEDIILWTKPYPGMPAEEWAVPTNKTVWGPRYLAEQLTKCRYHRLVMKQNVGVGSDQKGEYFGAMAADTIIHRLNARPATTRKSVFMGAVNF